MATFKYDLMSNVEAAFSNGRLWLGCDYDGARYHVWLTDGYRCENDALYKNPPLETPYGAPGYFDTLRLDARSVFARSLIGEMRARAQESGLLRLLGAGDARRERESSRYSGSRA